MKRLAIRVLALAIVREAAWLAVRIYRHHDGSGELWYAWVMTSGFAALATTRGRLRRVATMIRILVGLAFASAVADRLALLGGEGSPGVSWGTLSRELAPMLVCSIAARLPTHSSHIYPGQIPFARPHLSLGL